MQASHPHRTGRHPLIIHLAPKASTDQLSSRPATQNRTKAARRQSTHCQCPCNVPLCPSLEHLHNTASARSSYHGSMSNDTSMLAMRVAGAATSCDVSSRTIRTSGAENTFTSCPPGLDRPSSKLSMSHLLVATRLVAQQFGQQRQLRPVLPSGADEPFGHAINESVTFTHRSTHARPPETDQRHRERAVSAQLYILTT